MIARRLGSSTPLLRQLDGWADLALCLQLAVAVWLVDGAVVAALALPIAILFAGQIALYAFCIARYRRPPIFGAQLPVAGLWIALALGYLNTLDELLMTALLPRWHTDVLTLRQALVLREADLRSSAAR